MKLTGIQKRAAVQRRTKGRQAVAYVRANYREELYVAGVARMVGWSGRSLSDWLARERGQNFGELLNEVRLARAKRLLARTGRPLSWVAARCGYQQQAYFSRVFRQVEGLTPFRYRQRVQAGRRYRGRLRIRREQRGRLRVRWVVSTDTSRR